MCRAQLSQRDRPEYRVDKTEKNSSRGPRWGLRTRCPVTSLFLLGALHWLAFSRKSHLPRSSRLWPFLVTQTAAQNFLHRCRRYPEANGNSRPARSLHPGTLSSEQLSLLQSLRRCMLLYFLSPQPESKPQETRNSFLVHHCVLTLSMQRVCINICQMNQRMNPRRASYRNEAKGKALCIGGKVTRDPDGGPESGGGDEWSVGKRV